MALGSKLLILFHKYNVLNMTFYVFLLIFLNTYIDFPEELAHVDQHEVRHESVHLLGLVRKEERQELINQFTVRSQHHFHLPIQIRCLLHGAFLKHYTNTVPSDDDKRQQEL